MNFVSSARQAGKRKAHTTEFSLKVHSNSSGSFDFCLRFLTKLPDLRLSSRYGQSKEGVYFGKIPQIRSVGSCLLLRPIAGLVAWLALLGLRASEQARDGRTGGHGILPEVSQVLRPHAKFSFLLPPPLSVALF